MNATVSTRERAWQLADKLFPTDYMKDEHDSLRAGYPVFNTTSKDDKYTGFHISDLNKALELNMGAETIRIKHHRTKGGNNMAAVTNEKKNLNSQTEDVSEFIMLLKQMSDSDRMVIKGMMMWAAGENRPVKTA